MKKYLADILWVLVILTIAIAFFFNLFWPKPQIIFTPDFGRSDAWHFSFPTKYALWESLQKNQLPLWNEKMGSGFPLFAEGQVGALFLPNLILYKFLPPVVAYNVAYILILFFAGSGMYIWLRLMKIHPVAAFYAGVTFQLSGPILAQLPHVTLLQGISLLPIILACTLWLFNSKNSISFGILTLLLSQQIFAGFPQAYFITCIFLVIYYLWLVLINKKSVLGILLPVTAILLSLGLSAIQIVPSYEFLRNTSIKNGFDSASATSFSYPFKHLITMLKVFALGNPKLGTYPAFGLFDGSIFWENTGFIGWLPLILTGLFLVIKKTKSEINRTVFWGGLVFLAFLLMTGKYSPLYIIYSFWPFNLFRVPSRFIVLFTVSLIILSSMMTDKILKKYPKAALILMTIILLHIISLFSIWFNYHPRVAADTLLSPPGSLTRISRQDYVYTLGYSQIHNKYFVKDGWKNISPYIDLLNTLEPNSNLLWNMKNVDVYAGRWLHRKDIVTAILYDQIKISDKTATVSAVGLNMLALTGATTIISPLEVQNKDILLKNTINLTQDSLNFYSLPQTVPHAYLTVDTIPVNTVQDSTAAIDKPDFIPGITTLVESKMPGLSKSEKETNPVTILPSENYNLNLKVDTGSVALLVINDTYYPGWTATIDNADTKIFPANIQYQAILVPAGTHNVKFTYQPRSFRVGLYISLSFMLIILLIAVIPPVYGRIHTFSEAR